MNDSEQQTRIDLAAAYRLVAHFGLDDLVSTHISARLPDESFLLNPRRLLFHEITASSLVKIDLDGNVLSPAGAVINRAGFTIHSAIHAARRDVVGIVHLHGAYGTAVSMTREGLRPFSQKAMIFGPRLAYHDYEGVVLDLDERERLVANLGDKSAMILRNHGTLAVGGSLAEAFLIAYHLESACKMQVLADSTTRELATPSEGVRERVASQITPAFMEQVAHDAWPGLLRMLDARDPSYRD